MSGVATHFNYFQNYEIKIIRCCNFFALQVRTARHDVNVGAIVMCSCVYSRPITSNEGVWPICGRAENSNDIAREDGVERL